MKTTCFTACQGQTFRVSPAFFHRVNLGSGAIVALRLGQGADTSELFEAGRHARLLVSCPLAVMTDLQPRYWPQRLDSFGEAASRVELSLTADALGDCSIDMLLGLSNLRDAGFRLAVVGLRRHQLQVLSRGPLTTVVLDPGLVACLPDCQQAVDELSSITVAAQLLGLDVVAAGVETMPQCRLLTRLGISLAEGELFAKP